MLANEISSVYWGSNIQQSSIIHWSHINFYGEYDFTKLDRKDTKYIKDKDYSQLKI